MIFHASWNASPLVAGRAHGGYAPRYATSFVEGAMHKLFAPPMKVGRRELCQEDMEVYGQIIATIHLFRLGKPANGDEK